MPDTNNEFELRRDNAELKKRVTDLENAITERKQMEEELRACERQYFTIFNNANDLIHIVSPAGKILAVNKKWLTTLEYSQEEAKGLKVTDILLDDEIPQTSGRLKKVAEGESISIETVFISRSGKEINVEGNGKGIFIDGKFISAVGIFRDISERRIAVNALLEANKIINRSPAVAFLWSMEKDWPVEFVSDNVEILTGYSSREFVERKISYREIIHTDDLERVSGEVHKYSLIEGLQTYAHKPYRIITKSGEIKWVNDKTYIRRDSKGITTHHEGVVSDITDEKKLEGQLRQAQKMESVGRLAGGVAHDFNNMLSVILGHTEMALRKTTPSQPIHAHLTEIIKAAERSVNLTKQLLAFARKQTIAPRVLDLNKTVVGMIEMLRRLIGEDIHLTFLPGKDLWQVRVDPVQIDQILANLCINARDAIDGVGRVTIETGNTALDEGYCADYPGFNPGRYVLLTVSDTGSGMIKETQEKLFEPYFTTKEAGKGTGLGLSTIYGIVKQNDGFVYVYSEPGLGSIFKIYLPRHSFKSVEMQKDSPAEQTIIGHETILLVEDELVILELVMVMLERLGYTVLPASSPGDAIRLSKEHPDEIHLLMTDVVMPEMNGRDLAKNLLTCFPNLKRLFMSGYTADIIAHHGVLDEGVYFIQKPFTNQDLAVKVRQVLDSE